MKSFLFILFVSIFALDASYAMCRGGKAVADTNGYVNQVNSARFAQSAPPLAPTDVRDLYHFHFASIAATLMDWDKVVFWILRENQNIGAGTRLFSLGGLGNYHGELVGGASWSHSGMVVNEDGQHVRTDRRHYTMPTTAGIVITEGFGTVGYAGNSGPITSALNGFALGAYQTNQLNGNIIAQNTYTGARSTAGGNIIRPFMLVIRFSMSEITSFVNGDNVLVSNYGTLPPGLHGDRQVTPNNWIYIGARAINVQSLLGVTAFAFQYTDNFADDDTASKFYNLYKITLGRNLNIP